MSTALVGVVAFCQEKERTLRSPGVFLSGVTA